MADPRLRRERLLGLLPRIYTAQPGNSAVGAVIDSMAAALSLLTPPHLKCYHTPLQMLQLTFPKTQQSQLYSMKQLIPPVHL